MIPTLYGPRLRLRGIVPDDAKPLFPLFSDAQTMRFWSSPPFADIAALRTWLTPDELWPSWAILLDEAVIGRITLGKRRKAVAEIGYMLGRDWWGRGYAREAVTMLLDHGFGTGGLRRIFADIDPDNAASIALVERLGFVREGRLRQEWETHIGVRDSLIYGLLAEEWQFLGE